MSATPATSAKANPLRVLFFLTDLEIGGTPSVVRELAIRLRSPEIAPTVACLAPWGPVAGELRAAGIPTTALGATSALHLTRAIGQARRLYAKFDVVFSFLVHANSVAAFACRRWPAVRLIESIQTTQPYPAWHWPLQRWAAQCAERVVVPSASVARVATDWARVPKSKVLTIPNAIDTEPFVRLRRPRFAGEKIRVGFVGRLDPVKRVSDLVRAIALLPSAELDVFGEGEDRSNIVAAASEARVTDRVHLRGRVERSQQVLEPIDVLVLPSDAEGFGLVLIEAMAAGVPVVATDVPGIRDVVCHGETGLLVPPRTPSAIAAAILLLAGDAVQREAMIERAAAFVEEHFTWPRVIEQYRALLLTRRSAERVA